MFSFFIVIMLLVVIVVHNDVNVDSLMFLLLRIFISPAHLNPTKQNNRLSSTPAVRVGSGHSNIWTLCRPICLISFGNQTHFAVIKVREV